MIKAKFIAKGDISSDIKTLIALGEYFESSYEYFEDSKDRYAICNYMIDKYEKSYSDIRYPTWFFTFESI